jgi:hypothetical protein
MLVKTIALLALSIAALAATPAAAVDFTIGTGTSDNCFPFGCQLSGQTSTRYQQVYDAAAFPGAVTITALSFTVVSGGSQLIDGPVSISLSTTSVGVGSIDTVNFDANLGADNLVVFNDVLPALSGGLLTINFATPFSYNPVGGNLLFNLSRARGTDLSPGVGPFFAAAGGDSTVTSRAQNFGSSNIGWGLNTTFSTGAAVVPEPASWAMLIAGFGLVGAAARRRRAVAA